MKAVVFDGHLACRNVPLPTANGGVVLSVERAGICGTDLAIASNQYRVNTPLILGHEIFGTAWKVPDGRSDLRGKRCVTEINVGCGVCAFCRAGVRSHCATGKALGIHRDGGFAEYVSTPLENVHAVPDSISDEEAVFVEPLAACIQLTRMGKIDPGSACAVVGPGRMGLLIIQLLQLVHPRLLVAVGHEGPKLEMARSFGAEAFDVSQVDSAIDLTEGAKFDNVIEATGSPGGLATALGMVKPMGTLHLKSTHGVPTNIDITKVVVDELRIQGSRCGPFDESIRLLESRTISVRGLITNRFPLDNCEEAFRAASSRSSIKAIFEV
ncbi:MAG TPA: alcohol dehydrogenase catalytic domain-containing protein [Nitrososphaerales archaeon]|nr:alcohol dehydrogenase catalytic domain-containing protein [Nitrososphaerales archaeon]